MNTATYNTTTIGSSKTLTPHTSNATTVSDQAQSYGTTCIFITGCCNCGCSTDKPKWIIDVLQKMTGGILGIALFATYVVYPMILIQSLSLIVGR